MGRWIILKIKQKFKNIEKVALRKRKICKDDVVFVQIFLHFCGVIWGCGGDMNFSGHIV